LNCKDGLRTVGVENEEMDCDSSIFSNWSDEDIRIEMNRKEDVRAVGVETEESSIFSEWSNEYIRIEMNREEGVRTVGVENEEMESESSIFSNWSDEDIRIEIV